MSFIGDTGAVEKCHEMPRVFRGDLHVPSGMFAIDLPIEKTVFRYQTI